MGIFIMKRLLLIGILGLGLFALAGLPPTHVSAAPLAQASCTLPATVTTADQLYDCITAANAGSGGTITLGTNITLSAALPQITSQITLEGAGYTIDAGGDYQSRVFRRIFYVTSAGNFTVNQTTLQNGLIDYGGAIYNDGTLMVSNSTFSSNDVVDGGASIYNHGTATVSNSTFYDNEGHGAGIYNRGTLSVTNSTFSGNTSFTAGGIYNSGTATVTNSTFSNNRNLHNEEGGIFNTGTMNLAGNIFVKEASSGNCRNFGTLNDNGYNLSDDASCGFSGTGSANNATLPLGDLADNGGPTQTHLPSAGSDAIGAIPSGTEISNNGTSWTCDQSATDQRGVVRPISAGTACTAGAVEVASSSNVAPVAVDDSATTNENTPVNIAVLTNDTDTDGDTLTVVSVTQPTNGSTAIESDGTVTYTPTTGFSGSDSFTYTISDGNGGSDTATVEVLLVDTIPPEITPSVSGTEGNNGWYVGDVIVSFSCSDEAGGSGIATDTVAGTTLTSDGANQSVTNTGECIDNTGNTASSITVSGINIDKTAPLVTITGVTDGITYILGNVPTADCTTSDALSGVATAAILVLSGANPDGSGTITATCDEAVDNAGNRGSATATYTVLTPQEAIADIQDAIDGLVDDGSLKKGQANGLTKPLDSAIRSLDKGNIVAACNQLTDFIAEVNAKTPSPLDGATAAALIADAQAIQSAIGCTSSASTAQETDAGTGTTSIDGNGEQNDSEHSNKVFLPLVTR